MKNQVLTIEQMKHLQELGVDTSKAKICWCKYIGYDAFVMPISETYIGQGVWEMTPTFTLQDMLEMLPPHFYSFPFEDKERYVIHDMVIERLTGEWLIGYRHGLIKGELLVSFQDDLLTCAYEMLCWLAENNYIGGNDEKRD